MTFCLWLSGGLLICLKFTSCDFIVASVNSHLKIKNMCHKKQFHFCFCFKITLKLTQWSENIIFKPFRLDFVESLTSDVTSILFSLLSIVFLTTLLKKYRRLCSSIYSCLLHTFWTLDYSSFYFRLICYWKLVYEG